MRFQLVSRHSAVEVADEQKLLNVVLTFVIPELLVLQDQLLVAEFFRLVFELVVVQVEALLYFDHVLLAQFESEAYFLNGAPVICEVSLGEAEILFVGRQRSLCFYSLSLQLYQLNIKFFFLCLYVTASATCRSPKARISSNMRSRWVTYIFRQIK
jgi:hypothetical protein